MPHKIDQTCQSLEMTPIQLYFDKLISMGQGCLAVNKTLSIDTSSAIMF